MPLGKRQVANTSPGRRALQTSSASSSTDHGLLLLAACNEDRCKDDPWLLPVERSTEIATSSGLCRAAGTAFSFLFCRNRRETKLLAVLAVLDALLDPENTLPEGAMLWSSCSERKD